MGIIDLSMVISAIVSLGIKGVIDKVKRQEAIIKVLGQFGLQPGTNPKNFDEIYIFTLVEFGIDQPEAVLNFSEIILSKKHLCILLKIMILTSWKMKLKVS